MTRQHRQLLKDLQLKHKMEKYPTIPPHLIALDQWNDNSANALTKSIIAFLQFNGCQAERINTMGVYRKKYRTDGVAIGGQWTKGTGTPGTDGDSICAVFLAIDSHRIDSLRLASAELKESDD